MSQIADIISRKRQGEELARDEIEQVVLGYDSGRIPDYQMAAWLMAVCCMGMSRREAYDLTAVMAASGVSLDVASVRSPVADKHSTGGVGDKTTLVVAPLARACGLAVAKMSGRGLGFTGGTIDKLEAIPGFRTGLSVEEFLRQLESEGIVISGQTPELAPADGKIYALRDVTATVDSIPLIASSIMSKKLAIGAGSLVLDVKTGRGAFMTDLERARELAEMMVEIGSAAGMQVSALISSMDEPLGQSVGNALEVEEAIRTLAGEGPEDLTDLCLALAGEMLSLAGLSASPESGSVAAQRALSSGQGLEVFGRMVAVQGGDPGVVDRPEMLGAAPEVVPVAASRSGWISAVDARQIARAGLWLGAGRERKGSAIDPRVGVVLHRKAGAEVRAGDVLAEVHAADWEAGRRAAVEVASAYIVQEEVGEPPAPLVRLRVARQG
jgi:pyrimidine-nucleoside phosphorylase